MINIRGKISPQNIVKYSKNGCRLLSKTQEGNVKTAIIETDFGKVCRLGETEVHPLKRTIVVGN